MLTKLYNGDIDGGSNLRVLVLTKKKKKDEKAKLYSYYYFILLFLILRQRILFDLLKLFVICY